MLETHISYVLLAGEFAYKIKKPARLAFLDFSSLQARRFYCEEEVRLNRRTAPGLYLEVVAIGGEPVAFGPCDAPVEYAVKMKRFSQEGLLDRLARECRLGPGVIDALAHRARESPDASEAGLEVLDLQRRAWEPLDDDERAHCVALDTTGAEEWKAAVESLARRLGADVALA